MSDPSIIQLRPRTAAQMAPVLLRVSQAAARLQVSERTFRRWLRDGTVPHVRLGDDARIVRIPIDALDAWWQARKVGDT